MATIRLSYPRIKAVAGPCGVWPDDLGPSIKNRSYYDNKQYYNFGCAYQRNMAAMIDNPSDLEQPRPETPPYTARRSEALREVSQGHHDHDHLSRSRKGQTQRYRQMISYARQNPEEPAEVASPPADDHIAPAPRVSVQAFCETVETAAAVQAAGEDRRLGKAHLKIQMGGMAAAIEAYRTAPTPNVIVLETEGRNDILAGLDQLATVCDSGTRVIVIGRINDVALYRELVRRGVSDYVLAPVNALDVVRSICSLFSAPEAKAVGRIIAVVGAKGGVGASTIAHNVAWAIARDLALDSVVADLDLAFGTAGLDYNQDPPQGIADAVFSPDRIDTAFIDRLLSKCTDHLSLLAAPATLDRVYDFGADAFDSVFDTLRTTMPCIVLDVPHQWSGWTRRALVGADDILIVACARPRQSAQHQEHLRPVEGVAAQRPGAPVLPQPGRRAEAAGDQRIRIRQGDREPADRLDPVRAADLRLGGQQRPDDRGDLRHPSQHRDVPSDRATADGPWRDQEAAKFLPVTPDREAAGKVADPRGVKSCLVSVADLTSKGRRQSRPRPRWNRLPARRLPFRAASLRRPSLRRRSRRPGRRRLRHPWRRGARTTITRSRRRSSAR